ncbi:MAG: DotU family type IV/VI secretion system protein [Francisellaceae bacterium]
MWKVDFYEIIAKVDRFILVDGKSLSQLSETLFNDIQALTLKLLDLNGGGVQYGPSHLISFAITAYCDEKLNVIALKSGYQYALLQSRLFNTVNAGKIFYEYVESILSSRQTFPQVYWVYYFLLIHGYSGMYGTQSKFQRNMYIKQLKLCLLDKTTTEKVLNKGLLGVAKDRKTPWLPLYLRIPLSSYWVAPFCLLVAIYATGWLMPYL